MIVIEHKVQLALQNREVESQVVRCGCLPLQVVVAQTRAVVGCVLGATAQIVVGGSIGREEAVVTNLLVTNGSNAGTDFQVFYPLLIAQPLLFIDIP